MAAFENAVVIRDLRWLSPPLSIGQFDDWRLERLETTITCSCLQARTSVLRRAVKLGFKKIGFWVFKNLKNLKALFRFFYFLFLLCNLINHRYIQQILIAICEIRQFHLYFLVLTWCSVSFAHWIFVFSKICVGRFHVLLAFESYFRVPSSCKKNL